MDTRRQCSHTRKWVLENLLTERLIRTHTNVYVLACMCVKTCRRYSISLSATFTAHAEILNDPAFRFPRTRRYDPSAVCALELESKTGRDQALSRLLPQFTKDSTYSTVPPRGFYPFQSHIGNDYELVIFSIIAFCSASIRSRDCSCRVNLIVPGVGTAPKML